MRDGARGRRQVVSARNRRNERRAQPSAPPPVLFTGDVPMKVRELIRRLERDGWRQVRQRGSHRQFQHARRPGTVTVSGKLSADIPPGTLRSVRKQAGLLGGQR